MRDLDFLLRSYGCGCPVVASRTSSIGEVLKNRPCYSIRMSDIVDKVIIDNHAGCQIFCFESYQQVKRYTWAETTKLTKNLFATFEMTTALIFGVTGKMVFLAKND